MDGEVKRQNNLILGSGKIEWTQSILLPPPTLLSLSSSLLAVTLLFIEEKETSSIRSSVPLFQSMLLMMFHIYIYFLPPIPDTELRENCTLLTLTLYCATRHSPDVHHFPLIPFTLSPASHLFLFLVLFSPSFLLISILPILFLSLFLLLLSPFIT